MDSSLAYDVGAYDGRDTAHYLSLGYRVLCIEANPSLACALRHRFASEIARNTCTVLNVAVGATNGVSVFYESANPLWSSLRLELAARDCSAVTEILVESRRFADILADYGVPQFLKIDIEGADHECVNALGDDLPEYLSFEAQPESTDAIMLLVARGYSRFSLVRQGTFESVTVPVPGTLTFVGWAARQYARLQLRRWPRLHRFLRLRKRTYELRRTRSSPHGATSAGPTPMERHEGWYPAAEFLRVWCDAVHSGLIDSWWFDVHAARTQGAC